MPYPAMHYDPHATGLFSASHEAGSRVLVLTGELDLGSCSVLARSGTEFTRRCARTGNGPGLETEPAYAPDVVVIDAGGLSFVDAAGLGVLITLRADLARVGISVRVARPSTRLRRVTAICGLDDLLGIEPSHGPVEASSRNAGVAA